MQVGRVLAQDSTSCGATNQGTKAENSKAHADASADAGLVLSEAHKQGESTTENEMFTS